MLNKFGSILLGILATVYLSLCLLLRWGQTRLMFFPDPIIKSTPADYNLPYQDVWLRVDTGTVHGWWIESALPTAPTLLYLHGNGSNNGDAPDLAAAFRQLGLSVLLIDYRGYGKSNGTFPSETSVYKDAQAAWDYLTLQRKIAPQNIIIYGHSLGGAIAVELATRYPDIAGIILEGTFTSMRAMVDKFSIYKFLPMDWILTQHFDSLSKIKSIRVPLLIVHGTDDEIVPVTMSQKLFTVANDPKQLLLIPTAGHNNIRQLGGDLYLKQLQRFIQKNTNQNKS